MKSNNDWQTQSRRFLQSMEDNFLTWVMEEKIGRGVLLDFVLVVDSKVQRQPWMK